MRVLICEDETIIRLDLRAICERAGLTIVSEARGEPQGVVRVSCPTGLLGSPFAEAVHEFLIRHPKVRLALLATNRRVDLIEESLDARPDRLRCGAAAAARSRNGLLCAHKVE